MTNSERLERWLRAKKKRRMLAGYIDAKRTVLQVELYEDGKLVQEAQGCDLDDALGDALT
jgi:hypothetical protein